MSNNKQIMTNREERLQNPFHSPIEKYKDDFKSGYETAIFHMREAISHVQFQNDTEELQELFVYSRVLIEKLKEKFENNEQQ